MKPDTHSLLPRVLRRREFLERSGLGFAMLGLGTLFADEAELEAFDRVARKARMVRYGGDCYSYCMLAAGHVDLVIESTLKPHDVQALIPRVEAAGGVITGWSGESAVHGGQVIAAGDRRVYEQALELLSG